MAWIATVVYVLALLPYVAPILDAKSMAEYGDIWADIPLIGLVILVTLVGRPAAETRRERGFWGAVGAGFAFWFVGRVAWALLPAGLTMDLVADFLYLLLYIGLLVALELNPERPTVSSYDRRLGSCTMAGGAVLLLASYGYFALIPAVLSESTYESWKPAVVGTVVADGYFAIRLITRALRVGDPRWRGIYRWFAAAFLVWVATDAVHMVGLFRPEWLVPTGGIADLIWYVPYGILAIGALLARLPVAVGVPVGDEGPAVGAQTPWGGTPLIVYVFVLPVTHGFLDLAGMLDPSLRSAREVLMLGEAALLAVLMLRAHGMIMGENRRLRRGYEEVSLSLAEANHDLEGRVQQRTVELEDVNTRLATDIDKRKRVEELLRDAESRNRALIHAVPDGLIVVDEAGVIQEVHPARNPSDALDLAEAGGRELTALLPVRCRQDILHAIERTLAGESSPFVTASLAMPEGFSHWELRFSRCGTAQVLVLVQDVSDRRHAEAALLQSHKMESLGVMAGGIAHDFNNILAGIMGNAELIRTELAEDGAVAGSLAAIERSAQRAAKLTNNLLAYAGEAHIERVPIDLAHILDEMRPLLAAAVPKRLELSVDTGDAPMWIEGNEGQFTQIVLNLVNNAAESMAETNGGVAVMLDRVTNGPDAVHDTLVSPAPAPGPYVRLTVRDEGCGMTTDMQRRIFDPFYTSKATGRGLGLAAVLGIVSHHEGALALDSAPGRGTAFTIDFAACAVPGVPSAQPVPAAAASRGAGTVLVVDDEPDMRELLSTYMERLGFTVLEAKDGAEAVKTYLAHPGDIVVVLMDYAMPVLDGVEAYRRIRVANADVPVVMLSGYGERQALKGLQDQCRTCFMQKPFELLDLTAILRDEFGLLEMRAEG